MAKNSQKKSDNSKTMYLVAYTPKEIFDGFDWFTFKTIKAAQKEKAYNAAKFDDEDLDVYEVTITTKLIK